MLWLYTLLRNTHIQCTPQPPKIRLRANLQQIESKAYLFKKNALESACVRSGVNVLLSRPNGPALRA